MGDGVEFDWYYADELQDDRRDDAVAVIDRKDGTKLIFQLKPSKSYTEIGRNLTKDEIMQLWMRLNTRAFTTFPTTKAVNNDLQEPQLLTQSKMMPIQRDGQVIGWVAQILPKDWRSDLEELRCELLAQGRSRLVVSFVTLKSLLEMVWAGLWIKCEDFISPTEQETKQ